MNQKTVWIVLSLIVLVALAIFLTRRSAQAPTSSDSTSGTPAPSSNLQIKKTVISELHGTAKVTHAGKVTPAKEGQHLEEGDSIEVGTSSTVALLWPWYGRSILGARSVLEIHALRESADHQTIRIRLVLATGRIWTRLQQLAGGDGAFAVKASNVVAVVRGTSFGVAYADKKVNVQVVESRVRVFHEDQEPGPEELDKPDGLFIDVGQNQETIVSTESAVVPEPQAMTGAELEDSLLRQGNISVIVQDISDEEVVPLDQTLTTPSKLPTPVPTSTTPTPPVSQIPIIMYQGHQMPYRQLHIANGTQTVTAAAECTVPHYHALNGETVTALDQTVIQDPGGCGFGKVAETQVIQIPSP